MHRARTDRLALVVLVLLSAALAASTACRRSGGAPPERFLPATSGGVVVVPELRRAAQELGALQELAAAFPGSAQLPELRRSLAAQLGVDLLDPEGLAKVGIDPKRGLAVGVEPGAGAPALVVLPVRDAGALRAFVKNVARSRLGASGEEELPAAGAAPADRAAPRVLVHRGKEARLTVALGFGDADRTAVLSTGPGAPEAVRAALSLPPAECLAEAPTWRDLRKALGDRYAALFALLPSPGVRLPLADPVALGFTAQAGALRLGALARLDPAAAAALAAARGSDAKARVHALAPEAPLVLRWDGDPAALGRLVVPRLPERDRRWLSEHGFDVQRDLFDVLAPGAAASVSLSPRLDVSDLSDIALRADPLRVISFELAAEVKDEQAAGKALARLPALFAALEAPAGAVRPATADAAGRSGRIPTASGEIAWRLDGKRLRVAGGPAGALDALLARKAGFSAPTKDAAAALEGGAGGAVLVPRRLAASVRALPEEAFGTGPYGFVVRGIVDRYVEALETVEAVSVRAEVSGGALLVDARAEVKPAREARP